MSKVLVDRELLAQHVAEVDSWNEGVQKIIGEQPGYRWASLEGLRAALAQPAEADGVEVVAWRIGFPNGAGYKVYERRQDWAYENYGKIAYEVQDLMTVAQHLAALSAVTAERDALAAENKLLRGPEQTVVVCEKGKPFTFMSKDPCRYRLCEVTYAAPVRVLIEERNQLRAEVEALQKDAERLEFVVRHSGEFHFMEHEEDRWSVMDTRNGLTFVARNCDNLRSAIDAALAAKDGGR